MKRITFISATALLIGLFGMSTARAQSVVSQGSCGTNLTYVLLDDSTFTIYGYGAMNNYTLSSRPPWYSSYRNRIKTLVIGDSVTSIGNFAFYECSGLTSVTIPDSITNIGDWAFYSCGFTSITIPNSVTSIGGCAFSTCMDLRSVSISNSIGTIPSRAFHCCKRLASVIIPNNVKNVGDDAFLYCDSLHSVTIGSSVTRIENSAFYGCYKLDTIICLPIAPPTISNSNTFYNVPITVNIFVPCGTAKNYKAATVWKLFSNYIEMPFPTPINVSVTKVDNSFAVVWEGEAESYEVYRDNVLLEAVSTTTYTDTDLEEGTEYCYQIKAISGDCKSGLSTAVCKTFTDVIPVTSITGVPTAATVGTSLTLTSTVNPSDATNKTIVWSIADIGTTGATLNGNILTATEIGTVKVTATIANGTAVGTDYTQDFNIEVNKGLKTNYPKKKTYICLIINILTVFLFKTNRPESLVLL